MMKKKFGQLSVLNLLMITALLLAACAQATPSAAPEHATQIAALPDTGPSSANQALPNYWPTQDWRTSTPEQQGMDSAQLSKLFDAIQKADENVHSVVIIRNGYIVTEAYYSPFRPDARHNLQSGTERVVSILIGIAIQQGYIKGLDQKMLDFFPDRKIAVNDN